MGLLGTELSRIGNLFASANYLMRLRRVGFICDNRKMISHLPI